MSTDGYFSGKSTVSDTGQLLFVEPYWDIRLAGMNEEELRLFLQTVSNGRKR